MNRFLWLIRREIWESRVVWAGPAICAIIVIAGALIAGLLSHHIEFGMDGSELSDLNAQLTPAKLNSLASMMLAGVAIPFLILVMFTQFFYSIDALFGERRDRSVLFWKSLPVSDSETVLSKLAVATVVMPAAAAAGLFIAQIGVCVAASIKLAWVPGIQAHLWSPVVWLNVFSLDAYLMLTSMVWYLPMIAFYLLVSALAPRSPFGFAVLVPLGAMLAERIVFGSRYVAQMLFMRSPVGLFAHIFGPQGTHGLGFVFKKTDMDMPESLFSIMQPASFLSSPALWLGLLVGAGLVAGAVWARRYRDATN